VEPPTDSHVVIVIKGLSSTFIDPGLLHHVANRLRLSDDLIRSDCILIFLGVGAFLFMANPFYTSLLKVADVGGMGLMPSQNVREVP
jgi:hypothetical protein